MNNTPPLSTASLFSEGQPVIACAAILLVISCVLLHYEVLRKLSKTLARLKTLHRLRVLVLIVGLLLTHVLEIWIYAAAYGFLSGRGDFGHLWMTEARTNSGALDDIYFSFMTFTTVGYGDIVPVGPIRFIAATEALNGWVLLGWSASFTFLEMQRYWRDSGQAADSRHKDRVA